MAAITATEAMASIRAKPASWELTCERLIGLSLTQADGVEIDDSAARRAAAQDDALGLPTRSIGRRPRSAGKRTSLDAPLMVVEDSAEFALGELVSLWQACDDLLRGGSQSDVTLGVEAGSPARKRE
jgi:hypothetical protein